MLVALADTHGRTDPRLNDHLRETVAGADHVLHAGDFTTVAVVEAFDDLAGRFTAVSGNSDTEAVRARLSPVETVDAVDALDRRFLLVHGHDHDRTSLPLLARQENADIVVVGHTHSGGVERIGGLPVVNPGSHADPRGSRPTYAAFERGPDGTRVRLLTTDGESLATVGL